MIFTAVVVLAFVFQAVRPVPASAVSLAECEAYLCLPAGFSTHGGSPATACDPAHEAVLSRLRRHLDPLPEWSSCAAQFGWDAAHLDWTFPIDTTCPQGGRVNGAGLCQGRDENGCTFTYSPRRHGNVWVHVDGTRTGQSLPYTVAHVGALNVDTSSCRPPDGDCADCPPGDGNGGLPPPQVVGPPASTAGNAGAGGAVGGAPGVCNTIGCPHVRHGWGAAPLTIHWTLRTAPPATHQ